MKKYTIGLFILLCFLFSCGSDKIIYISKDEAIQKGLIKDPYQDREFTYTISLKLLDIETAQVISSKTEETKTSTAFKEVAIEMLQNLFKEIKISPKKERIAILTEKNTDLDKKIEAHLETEIVNKKQFILLERSKIDKILEEQKFNSSDLVDETKTSRLGKIMGVTKIILVNLLTTNN